MMKKLFILVLVLFFMVPMPVMGSTVEEDKAMGDSYVSSSSYTTRVGATPSAPVNTVAKGVDISHHQGTIDFTKLKNEVDFVIIRCGYGSDLTNQDDKCFEEYVKGCRDNDIPYGIYLYSYANTLVKAKSEAQHTLRQLNKLKDWNTEPTLPIFYDMEDNIQKSVSASLKADIAQTYCEMLQDEGYETGIYANYDWFTNYLTDSYFDTVTKWVAEYNSYCKYQGTYSMWQCTSNASISGISGSSDLDYMIENIYTTHDLSYASVSGVEDKYYTGSAIEQNISVILNRKVLTNETDYIVEYNDNVDLGTATITITGQGEYTGTISVKFNITLRYSPKANGYKGTYDSTAHTINVYDYKPDTTVQYSTDQKNWTTTPITRTNAGTTRVYYQALNELDQTITGYQDIVIYQRNISTCSISKPGNKNYTGKAIKPSITVKYNGKKLTSGKDYTVSYKNNKNLGTATITITGKGNFKGTYKRTFKIILKKPTISKVTSSKKALTVKWSKITGASGYVIYYKRKGTSKWYSKTVYGTSKKLTGLSGKKYYYVRIRAFKVVNKKRVYSSYSSTKTVKTK